MAPNVADCLSQEILTRWIRPRVLILLHAWSTWSSCSGEETVLRKGEGMRQQTHQLRQHSQLSPPHALSTPTAVGAGLAEVTPLVESMLASRWNGLSSSVPGRLLHGVRGLTLAFSSASTSRLGASGKAVTIPYYPLCCLDLPLTRVPHRKSKGNENLCLPQLRKARSFRPPCFHFSTKATSTADMESLVLEAQLG